MPYLVDSDWVIDHLGGVDEAAALLDQLAEEGIAVSVITYMEVYQGVVRSPQREEAQALFDTFLAAVPVIPFSRPLARRCAALRETLRQQGKRVNARALDLLIAATALEYGLTLVTRNVGDYSDIPDLELFQSPSP